jgi:NAD/NADP transhydrogenase alpha subunit
MAVGVAGFAFGGRAEHGGNIVVAFDVGLLCEIEVTAVGLAFTSERGLEVFLGLRSLQSHDI